MTVKRLQNTFSKFYENIPKLVTLLNLIPLFWTLLHLKSLSDDERTLCEAFINPEEVS